MERATPPAFDFAAPASKHCGGGGFFHVGGFTVLTVPTVEIQMHANISRTDCRLLPDKIIIHTEVIEKINGGEGGI